MKIKLFLSSSLCLLGVWLAAAYVHTVDLASYHSSAPNTASVEIATPQLEEEIDATVAAQ